MVGLLLNRVQMSVSGTPGTGTVTLGSAQSGFQSFASAGASNGQSYQYLITEGVSWEVGSGIYTSSGTTLSRPGPSSDATFQSSSGSLVSFTSACIVSVASIVSNLSQRQFAGVRTTVGTTTSASITLGSTPIVGNTLIGIVSGYSNGSVQQVPAGFTQLYSNQSSTGSNQGILVYYRTVQSGDGTSWTTTFSGSNNGGQAFVLLEVANMSGFSASTLTGSPSGTTWSFAASKLSAQALTIMVTEADSSNGYSSVSGPATLLFDGTGGPANHPSVYLTATGFGTATITFTGSSYSFPIVTTINIL